MPRNLPSYDTIVKRIRADVRAILSALDPTIFSSFIRGITDSNAGRHYDNVLSLAQLEKELFPTDEASTEALEVWAKYEGLEVFEATQSSGNTVFTGTPGSTITDGDEFRSSGGLIFNADETVSLASNVIAISSLSRSGSTVTAVVASTVGLATGTSPTIAGAVETDYNGVHLITVLDATSFTYEITTTPTTPATGTITATLISAVVPVVSAGFGQENNLDSGAVLSPTGSISGVANEGFVDVNGLLGGQDEETNVSLLRRTIQSRANPVANFNVSAITKAALSIQGVTRVKVKRVTPDVGQVTILFVRDDDDNLIPSAAEVAEVKAEIVEILQATSEEADVIVTAPTAVPTAYSFSSITPSTVTMQSAIDENLAAFYQDEVTFETNITEEKYKNAIIGTIDPDTGDSLESFTLASPSGDISVTTDQIGTYGGSTF